MSPLVKVLKFVVRLADGAVNLAALVLILSAMLLSGYSLWDANQVYLAADAASYEAYVPTEEDTRSYEELRAINPEVIGWIRVNDTSINYPLLQAQDNEKYVNMDLEGNFSLSGAIFLNCMNAPDFSDFNSIIYGHHMEKNKMFGDIGLFSEEKYFDAHPYGNLFFGGKDHGVEFFAFLTVDAYDDLFWVCGEGTKERQAYLDDILERALYLRKLEVTTKDRLVLLSTCTTSMTNGRNILVGRLTGEVYPEKEEPLNFGNGVDRLEEVSGIPGWAWILAAILLVMILTVLVLKLRQRRKNKNKRRREKEVQSKDR